MAPAAEGSPLDVARRGLSLDAFELAVILLCLLPEIDGVRGLTAFLLEDVGEADRVLTF